MKRRTSLKEIWYDLRTNFEKRTKSKFRHVNFTFSCKENMIFRRNWKKKCSPDAVDHGNGNVDAEIAVFWNAND